MLSILQHLFADRLTSGLAGRTRPDASYQPTFNIRYTDCLIPNVHLLLLPGAIYRRVSVAIRLARVGNLGLHSRFESCPGRGPS